MKILSIDPSVNDVGWTTFEVPHEFPKKQFALNAKEIMKKAWKWGTWHLSGSSLEQRMYDLALTITAEIGEFHILIAEKPAFYSSQRGQIAAHQNYTIDLSAINSFLAGWFHMTHRSYFPITAINWKGSVSKWITQQKFFRIFKVRPDQPGKHPGLTEHSVDATMMLHYWLKTYGLHSTLLAPHISAESLKLLL